MRSRHAVKKAIPSLMIAMSLSAIGAPAHAGTWQTWMSKFFKKPAAASAPINAAAAPSSVSANVSASVSGNVAAPVEQVFDAEKDLIQTLANSINAARVGTAGPGNFRRGMLLDTVKMEQVNTETHTDIEVSYDLDSGLHFRFLYDDVALQNPELLIPDLAFLAFGSGSSSSLSKYFTFNYSASAGVKPLFESPHAIAELITDAKAGSPPSQARLQDLRARIYGSLTIQSAFPQSDKVNTEFMVNLKQAADGAQGDLDQQAAKYLRTQQKVLDQWRSNTQALDKYENMQDKLDDLIMKNDRHGVAEMIRAYLPWTIMEPVETQAWKTWLEAIEFPDASKTTVAFRGTSYDTDKIQRRMTGNGEIFGFMSTVLTKNQGSYTRRLRSLSTNRLKNGDLGADIFKNGFSVVRMTDQMTSHARNPQASSFLSFTYSLEVASGFMGSNKVKTVDGKTVIVPGGGMLAVKVDSRRMVPNMPSMYSNEIELLAPLIIFPDEVVMYKEGNWTNDSTKAQFVQRVTEKTGIDFVNWSSSKKDDEMVIKYRHDGFNFLNTIMEKSTHPSCSAVLL